MKFYPRERKREEQRREGGVPGRREEHVWAARAREERGLHASLDIPLTLNVKRLNYP